MTDETEELRTQIHYRLIEDLKASESRYRNLVNELREVVFEVSDGVITFLNPAWTEELGHPTEEAMSRPIEDFVESSHRTAMREILEHEKKEGNEKKTGNSVRAPERSSGVV